ncbi:hypothetical protein EXE58_03535 [Nocardioides seonyuensis]|uniref:Polysaccharide chain length determinant N-terminal domain-containing protein n=1 Tax=Nocardioides seonyuensis TaxID=2518371 RepID=A0A4P7IFZ8_9ACTN|nr:hypothetical protein [Nocardioides seonyuensis]QBX54631.1 hypothetical protein EXE58_03535 [Nocardioides seonyuensis]
MDVWGITVAALRRWYVLLPLLVLTVFAALAVGRGMQPEYEAVGVAVYTPGSGLVVTEEDVEIRNPYGSLDEANTIIGIVLDGPVARSEIAAMGLDEEYEVSPGSRSAIMQFSVRADSPEVAIRTGAAVFEMAATELRTRQDAANVPKNAQYGIQVLQAPYIEAAVTDGKLRNMAIIVVLGGALSLLIAVFFDDLVGLARRRRERRKVGQVARREDRPASGDASDESLPPRHQSTTAETAISDAR